jgi:phosphomannomutase
VHGAGGVPIVNKAGHSFIKERMRSEDAVFAGEMSGHFYFRDFWYADNGLIPFLMVLEILSRSGKKLSELFDSYFAGYFISGELNTKLPPGASVADILARIEANYADARFEKIDGLSLEYPEWRANIRSSNTEPLLRLNVEARQEGLVAQKVQEIQGLYGIS